MPTKAEQTERTRAALVVAGRELFAEHGYAATATEEVVRAAGVTRGALYHHFRDKLDLFEAVYEDLEAELSAIIMRAIGTETDPIELLRIGVDAFLDSCLDPAIQRIVLLEGPTVLGWERWHEIEMRHGLGLTLAALQGAMGAGAIPTMPLEPLAHVLLGALIEGSILLAQSPNPRKARRDVGRALYALIDGLAATA